MAMTFGGVEVGVSCDEGFEAFFADAEPRLRRALVARFGSERGREATAEALAWAYEHWSDVEPMTNGVGYLYRVGVSRTRPRKVVEPARVAAGAVAATSERAPVDPELSSALATLSEHQRVAVVLVHGFGWSMKDAAELLEVAVPTIGTHLRRGLASLRRQLDADDAPGGSTIPRARSASTMRDEERSDG